MREGGHLVREKYTNPELNIDILETVDVLMTSGAESPEQQQTNMLFELENRYVNYSLFDTVKNFFD